MDITIRMMDNRYQSYSAGKCTVNLGTGIVSFQWPRCRKGGSFWKILAPTFRLHIQNRIVKQNAMTQFYFLNPCIHMHQEVGVYSVPPYHSYTTEALSVRTKIKLNVCKQRFVYKQSLFVNKSFVCKQMSKKIAIFFSKWKRKLFECSGLPYYTTVPTI